MAPAVIKRNFILMLILGGLCVVVKSKLVFFARSKERYEFAKLNRSILTAQND